MKCLSSNSIKRIAAALLLMSLLLPLTSCFSESAGGNAEALLRKPSQTSSGFKGELVEVKYGTISRVVSGGASIVFPKTRRITCSFSNARLIALHFNRGDRVKEGDLLAEFVIEYNESDLIALRSEFEIAEKQYESMKSSYESGVSASEDRLASLREQYAKDSSESLRFEVAKAEIQLKKAKSSYDFFIYEQQRYLKTLRKSIDDFEKTIGDNKIYAPFDGVIANAEYLPLGTIIAPGTEICTIYSDDVMWISTTSDITNGMRYNCEAVIKVTPSDKTYGGRIISAPDIYGMPTGSVIVIPDVPIDIDPNDRVRRLSVSAKRYELENVLVLPSSAVEFEDKKRYVYVYEDGIMKKRYVSTGLASIDFIQIIDGLEAGQMVVID